MADNNRVIQKFAYYVIPDIEALAIERDPDKRRFHRRRIAANIGDQDALKVILGEASEDFHDFYGVSDVPRLSTADTIDSFIEKFGTHAADTIPEGEGVVPVASPAVDYAALLEEQMAPADTGGDVSGDVTLGAIDEFLSKRPAPRVKPKKDLKEVEKPSLTESFAKIMIKNGNYRRALEIITEISLNNPEKSIYFADQIRFLKKVISLESQ